MRIPLLPHNKLRMGLGFCLLTLFCPLSAQINLIQLLQNGNPGIKGLGGVSHAALSPDGRYMYTAARFDHHIGVFAVDPISGLLTPVADYPDGEDDIDRLAGVLALRVTTDGRFLYAAAFDDDAITVFSRNVESGLLTEVETLVDEVEGVDGLQGVRDLVLSPDDRFLYAIGSLDNTLSVFNRDSGAGTLTLHQAYAPDVDDAAHELAKFSFPANLVMDDQGLNLYVTSRLGNNLYHFSRVAGGGDLDLVEVHQEGEDNIEGMTGPDALTISPDGLSLYVAGDLGGSLAHFNRNAASGRLDIHEIFVDDNDSIDGLAGATGVTVSQDGSTVYVTSRLDDALLIYNRATSGELSLETLLFDDQNGFTALAGARDVLSAPGGQVLYLFARDDNAINVFHNGALDLSPIEPPRFVRHHHFYRDSDQNLHIRLPDPKSDGLILEEELGYALTLEQKGRTLWGPLLVFPEADNSSPELVIDAADLPLGTFAVGVRRATNLAHVSSETLFPVPRSDTVLPDLHSTLFKRWLLHIPKPSAGFNAILHLNNRDLERSAPLTLVAFEEDGQVLAIEELIIAEGSVNRFPVYGSSESAVFSGQEELVSHIAIWEETPRCTVSLACLSQSSDFFAMFETCDLADGEGAGSLFSMPGRRNAAIGEGLAVLNLGGLEALEVTLKQHDEVSGDVLQILSLGSVPPGSKRLFALSGLMPFVSGAYYTLESVDSNSRFQAMGIAFSEEDFLSVVPLAKLR